MELIKVMEGITLVVTLLMSFTGIFPTKDMYKTKSTKNVPYHMFLLFALSCGGMLHYGIMIENGILIFLNAVGVVMQIIYVVVYLIVVSSKTKPLLYLSMAVLYDAVLYGYLYTKITLPSERADVLGSCSSLLTTFIMILPALEVLQNIRNKNADGMPPIMLYGGIACGTSWLIYGIMLDDPNIYSPNIPGLFISWVKVYIIWLYGKKIKHE